MRVKSVRHAVGVAFAIAATALMSACVHVPARVWYNGQAMESTWQYGAFMNGEHTMQMMRGMYWNSNALRLAYPEPARFQPFGNW